MLPGADGFEGTIDENMSAEDARILMYNLGILTEGLFEQNREQYLALFNYIYVNDEEYLRLQAIGENTQAIGRLYSFFLELTDDGDDGARSTNPTGASSNAFRRVQGLFNSAVENVVDYIDDVRIAGGSHERRAHRRGDRGAAPCI